MALPYRKWTNVRTTSFLPGVTQATPEVIIPPNRRGWLDRSKRKSRSAVPRVSGDRGLETGEYPAGYEYNIWLNYLSSGWIDDNTFERGDRMFDDSTPPAVDPNVHNALMCFHSEGNRQIGTGNFQAGLSVSEFATPATAISNSFNGASGTYSQLVYDPMSFRTYMAEVALNRVGALSVSSRSLGTLTVTEVNLTRTPVTGTVPVPGESLSATPPLFAKKVGVTHTVVLTAVESVHSLFRDAIRANIDADWETRNLICHSICMLGKHMFIQYNGGFVAVVNIETGQQASAFRDPRASTTRNHSTIIDSEKIVRFDHFVGRFVYYNHVPGANLANHTIYENTVSSSAAAGSAWHEVSFKHGTDSFTPTDPWLVCPRLFNGRAQDGGLPGTYYSHVGMIYHSNDHQGVAGSSETAVESRHQARGWYGWNAETFEEAEENELWPAWVYREWSLDVSRTNHVNLPANQPTVPTQLVKYWARDGSISADWTRVEGIGNVPSSQLVNLYDRREDSGGAFIGKSSPIVMNAHLPLWQGLTIPAHDANKRNFNGMVDLPRRTISINRVGQSIITEGTPASFRISADAPVEEDIVVQIQVIQQGNFIFGGTAPNTATIALGNDFVQLDISTFDDNTDEPDGLISVEVLQDDAYDIGSPSSSSVTVLDNDDPPPEPNQTVMLQRVGNSVVNEGTSLNFRVRRGESRDTALEVQLDITETGDMLSNPPTSATIPANSRNKTVVLITDNDSEDEVDSVVTVDIPDGQDGIVLGNPTTLRWTVEDDDLPPLEASLRRLSGASITEGTAGRFRVELNRATSGRTNLNISITETGDSLAPGHPTSVTIAAGSLSVDFEIDTLNDIIDEDDSVVTVRLQAGSGYNLGSPTAINFTVIDDDAPPPIVNISVVGSTAITEGASARLRLDFSEALQNPTRILLRITETGNMLANVPSFFDLDPGIEQHDFNIGTTGDLTEEPDSVVTVELLPGPGYVIGVNGSVAFTARDDDAPEPDAPIITILPNFVEITEGGNALFTVSANVASEDPLTVGILVSATGDFISDTRPSAVIIRGGRTTQVLSIPTIADIVHEDNGVITVRLQDSTDYTVGMPGEASVVVLDDDEAPDVPITPAPEFEGIPTDTAGIIQELPESPIVGFAFYIKLYTGNTRVREWRETRKTAGGDQTAVLRARVIMAKAIAKIPRSSAFRDFIFDPDTEPIYFEHEGTSYRVLSARQKFRETWNLELEVFEQ